MEIQENKDQKNSVFGHFSRSVSFTLQGTIRLMHILSFGKFKTFAFLSQYMNTGGYSIQPTS